MFPDASILQEFVNLIFPEVIPGSNSATTKNEGLRVVGLGL